MAHPVGNRIDGVAGHDPDAIGNRTGTYDCCKARGLIQPFFRIAMGYWRGPTRTIAWLLSLGFLACLIANLLLALAVNRWSKVFFDALQYRQPDGIARSIGELAVLIAAAAVIGVATIQVRMRLQLGWRIWLMSRLIGKWLRPHDDDNEPVSILIDNPEARIADDVRIAVDLFVDLTGGVINIALVASSFIVVLWRVGGSHELFGVIIPGYLVFAAFLYAATTTFAMAILARPLVKSVEGKAAAEGDFRFALTRTREQQADAGGVSATRNEALHLRDRMATLAARWGLVIRGQTQIALLTSANNLLAPAVPLLLSAPKFLTGAMTLGDLIQAAAAFVLVQTSLNWLADNALSLANWSASAHRVGALGEALETRAAPPAAPPV